MLAPKIFIGLFWCVGIIILIHGLKKIIKNYKTETLGEECYGRIIKIFKSGVYINNVPELKATIAVYINSSGSIEYIDEVIGLATKRLYNVGDYIEGKYYNGDVNIISYIPENALPSSIQYLFKDIACEADNKDTIFVDGVEYVRKDSIKDNN